MHYLLAIDQGTSSTRAMVYTLDGQCIRVSQYPINQCYPKPGFVEQDPEELWQKTQLAIREVLATVNLKQVIACGLTNQRETTLVWDRETGECLAPAIVWQDRRTEAFCASLNQHGGEVTQKTGLRLDPYFSASKIHWLLTHVPQVQKRMNEQRLLFGTVDSFLIWRLTGGKSHVTDITNASRTLLFNIHTQSWDEALLKYFSIPASILPKVLDSDAHFGVIPAEHFGVEIPITGVLGDQQAALIGQGCVTEGMIKATFGTGGFLMLNTGSKPVISEHQLLTTIAYRAKGETIYGLEGSFYQAGSTIKWLRDELKLFTSAEDTEPLAQSLDCNEGVYMVPSFTGLGAPYWISTPGAAIIGLSRSSHRGHFARAALESVAYQTRDVLVCMREDSPLPLRILRADGGMATNQWFLQFLANQCDLVVQRPKNTEATALGAAMMAAIGCGAMADLESLQQAWRYEVQFSPKIDLETKEADYRGWQRAIKMIKAGSIA